MKVTSVVVSHHLPSIFKISDRVAMLHQGEIVIEDTPDAVKNSTNPIVQEFLFPERDSILVKVEHFGYVNRIASLQVRNEGLRAEE